MSLMTKDVYKKLAVMTEDMYASLMKRVEDGYFAKWNPRFVELNKIMEALSFDYSHCTRGKELEKHYDNIMKLSEEVEKLFEEVFKKGNLEYMKDIQERLPRALNAMKQDLEIGIQKYDTADAKVNHVDKYEQDFIALSKQEVSNYKVKLRNRINQNLGKVRMFEGYSEQERRHFITHVLFFDEGKLENTILEALNNAEREVEREIIEVQRKIIISPKDYSLEERKVYVYAYREKEGKESPKLLSISRKILQQGEIGNKFENWFNSLVGEESLVGKLINEGNQSSEFPIEEQMFDVMEQVIDNNLGDLKMTEMLDAYKEECAIIKERSFSEFYGKYDEIQNLLFIIDKALKVLPSWEMEEICIADIIMA